MYYEINIAKDGKHFFATAERSITTEKELKKALIVFQNKFPKEEGYEIIITSEYPKTSYLLNIDDIFG